MSADLHCHTRLSDGSMGIDEILQLAAKNGVDTIAITDHDCTAANVRAKLIGERNGVRVLPAVELSATDSDSGREIHILAYLCDFPDRLEGLCHENSLIRKKAGQYMMLKAAKMFPITPEFIIKCAAGSTNLYPRHIMHALLESGFTNSIFGKLYDEIFTEAGSKSILVTPKFKPAEQIIELIHAAGGLAVLAHPIDEWYDPIIDKLLNAGLDGIEVWSPELSKERTAHLTAYAKKNKLLMTGGSNFHGMYNKTPITIGACVTPKVQLDELVNFKAKKRRMAKKEAEAAAAV